MVKRTTRQLFGLPFEMVVRLLVLYQADYMLSRDDDQKEFLTLGPGTVDALSTSAQRIRPIEGSDGHVGKELAAVAESMAMTITVELINVGIRQRLDLPKNWTKEQKDTEITRRIPDLRVQVWAATR